MSCGDSAEQDLSLLSPIVLLSQQARQQEDMVSSILKQHP